jgi:hypothetical protein
MQIRDINVHMTGNAVRAVDEVCKSLKFFLLQTGTNVRCASLSLSLKVSITTHEETPSNTGAIGMIALRRGRLWPPG